MKFPLDVLRLNDQLTVEERLIDEAVEGFAQAYLAPKVRQAFLNKTVDRELLVELGSAGLLGMCLPEAHGGAGASTNAYGVAAFAIESVDSGYRSAFSVQNSLVIHPIYAYGSADQRAEFLPGLIAGTQVGCFGLTEPNAGSDPSGLQTKAIKQGGKWLLRGEKTWISHAPVADVLIIWAKDSNGQVLGFSLPRNTEGIETPFIDDKLSLLTSPTGSIVLNDVVVSDDYRLPGVRGIGSALGCLTKARLGIAWGALGAATACWETALQYVLERKQFGKPLAANQLIQWKLAEMQTEISLGVQACLTVGLLQPDNADARHDPVTVSMLKRNSTRKALTVARMARDMLGGNGIHSDYDVMRHLINLETVHTYEGTEDIHALVLGKAQTGINAFA